MLLGMYAPDEAPANKIVIPETIIPATRIIIAVLINLFIVQSCWQDRLFLGY